MTMIIFNVVFAALIFAGGCKLITVFVRHNHDRRVRNTKYKGPVFAIDWKLFGSSVFDRVKQEAFERDILGYVRREKMIEEIERAADAPVAVANGVASSTPNGVTINNATINIGSAPSTGASATPIPDGIGRGYFAPDEPTTFDEYDSQHGIIKVHEKMILALPPEKCAIDPQLYIGPPGMGKTLLAKVIYNELMLRNQRYGYGEPDFIEMFPADIANVDEQDNIIRRAARTPGSVLFIDEIHGLSEAHTLKLYMLLAEKRYQYHGDVTPTLLPNITVLGATTDPGLMHQALLRRFNVWYLQPNTPEELFRIIKRRDFDITDDAASLIVERTKFSGAPWEGLQIRKQSEIFARARNSNAIELHDVEEVLAVKEIDELGLLPVDRKVLRVMLSMPRWRNGRGKNAQPELIGYGGAEGTVCGQVPVDKGYYRESIKPKLMSRRLMEVRHFGQCLTDAGLQHIQKFSTQSGGQAA